MNIKLLNLIVSLGLIFNFLGGNPEPNQPTGSVITNRLDLIPTWTTGIESDGIGSTKILVTDLNQDGKNDIAACSVGHAFVKNIQPDGDYQPIWHSDNINCERIVYADRDFNGISELYILTGVANSVLIVDVAAFTVVGTLPLPEYANDIDVADVDGDGALEIVVVFADQTSVYDAATLTVEWEAVDLGGFRVETGNIDADPLLEIVVNGIPARVLDAGQKNQQWTYSEGFGDDMSLGDVDGDGRKEIAFMSRFENVYVLDGDSQTIKWQLTDMGYLFDILTVDVNADGLSEVILCHGLNGVNLTGYRGSDGTILWSISNPVHGVSEISAGDVNNDGIIEILWGAGIGSSIRDVLIIGSWVNQTVEWISDDLDWPLYVASGDLDLDGQVEIVMASFSTNSGYKAGKVRIYDGITHALEWSIEIDSSFYDIYRLEVGQLDLDPALEILIGGEDWYDTRLQVYDGVTRTLEWASLVLGANAARAVLVENIDGDAVDEIIIGLSTAHVQVLNGASEIIQWDSGMLNGPIVDMSLGNLGLSENMNLTILTNEGLYVYDVGTWARVSYRLVGGGRQVAMIEADSNEAGQLLITTVTNDSYTLEALEAKSLEPVWQHPLGKITVKDLTVSDLDADTFQEFIVGGSTGERPWDPSLLMIGSKNHPKLWKCTLKRNLDQINDIDISDVDLDGKPEMLIGSASMIQMNEIVATEEVFHLSYLPVVSKPHPPRGLYGKVTYQGTPAEQVDLALRFYNGSAWSTVASLTTASDGSYVFNGIPNLNPGQAYYVLYQNSQYGDPDRLWTWHTRLVNSYSNGDDINIGDFDLENIPLVSPSNDATVSLPYTFQLGPTVSHAFRFL